MIIKKTESGLKYRLVSIGIGQWYLSANDGMVPSGQKVYGFCLKEILESIGCQFISL